MIPSTNTYLLLIFGLFFGIRLPAQISVELNETPLSFVCTAFPIKESATSRSVIAKNALWDVGQTIKVGFLNGSPLLQDTVKHFVAEWAKYANVQFKFVENGKTNIRIYFNPNSIVSYSSIGTYSRYVNQTKPTMVLALKETDSAALLRRVILHEFGHALGLFHEHQHPENDIQWNKEVVYDYYAQIGWSKGLVDYYVFNKFSKSITQFCEYDPSSIMHYPIPATFTLNDFSVSINDTLSKGDTSFIKKIYPFDLDARDLKKLCAQAVDSNTIVNQRMLNPTQNTNLKGRGIVGPNYPNPFIHHTTLPFWIGEKSKVKLNIYTLSGQQVYHGTQVFEKGWHQQELKEELFPKAGIYIYRLQVGEERFSGRMIRL